MPDINERLLDFLRFDLSAALAAAVVLWLITKFAAVIADQWSQRSRELTSARLAKLQAQLAHYNAVFSEGRLFPGRIMERFLFTFLMFCFFFWISLFSRSTILIVCVLYYMSSRNI